MGIGEHVSKTNSIHFESHLLVWMISAVVSSTSAGKEKVATSYPIRNVSAPNLLSLLLRSQVSTHRSVMVGTPWVMHASVSLLVSGSRERVRNPGSGAFPFSKRCWDARKESRKGESRPNP